MSRIAFVKALWVYRFFQLQQRVLRIVSGVFMSVRCWLWGIVRQSGHQYFGLSFFVRHPTATIQIGRDAVFRSASGSNSIGLNRACRFTAAANASIIIGDDCGFSGVVIAAETSVVLGDRVMCGANVTITDSDRHPLDAIARANGGAGAHSPVTIGDDVWLGLNVVVLKGVTIGNGAVIAANSVVTSDIPPYTVAGGQPAAVLKSIPS
jgi:acetyltransferase-like isoleucine patch superfamily enzyme